MVNYYIFALCSLLAGGICLFLSHYQRYFERVEKSYGQAAAQKMTRSLKIWGYFLLSASGVLILALIFEGAR
jgi:hypothetical protein